MVRPLPSNVDLGVDPLEMGFILARHGSHSRAAARLRYSDSEAIVVMMQGTPLLWAITGIVSQTEANLSIKDSWSLRWDDALFGKVRRGCNAKLTWRYP